MVGLILSLLLRPLSLYGLAHGVNLRTELAEIQHAKSELPLRLISHAPGSKVIALTFDDGPHPATPQLLKILKAEAVPATFFVVGKMVDRYPDLVRAEVAAGHEIGNHTYHHYNLETLSEGQVAKEYALCSDAIQRAVGFRPHFCRPPGGRFDPEVVEAASSEKMWTVLWTDDPGDFARPDPALLVERINHQLKRGGILLLHDGIPQTLQILPQLIEGLKARGYRFVTCSGLLPKPEVSISATACSRSLVPHR